MTCNINERVLRKRKFTGCDDCSKGRVLRSKVQRLQEVNSIIGLNVYKYRHIKPGIDF